MITVKKSQELAFIDSLIWARQGDKYFLRILI